MSTLKKHKVVMLPTNEKATIIGKYKDVDKLVFNTPKDIPRGEQKHLYIISDEEIKEGDWGIGHAKGINGIGTGYYVFKHDNSNIAKVNALAEGSKKIIATTDKSLGLASPSTSFIEKFVEEYNKDNVITDVMVEYEELARAVGKPLEKLDSGVDDFDKKIIGHKLKINPKDNTITIKKVKDSWSREEVIDLLTRYNKRCQAPMVDTKWISENL